MQVLLLNKHNGVTITDTNDQTPVYQAADADDAISVNENVGTGSIDAGTITDTGDTSWNISCTRYGADAADFACSKHLVAQ